jgi:hypothetical protein
VEFHLKVRLLSVGGERPFADDEAHNVPNVEFAHGVQYSVMFRSGTEARGTVNHP